MVLGYVHHIVPNLAFIATKSSTVALEISVMSTQSFEKGHFSPKILSISQAFPGTFFLRSKYLKDVIIVPNVTRMVVCQSCHSLFSFNNCLVKTGSKLIIQSCSNCLKGGNTVQLLKRVVTICGSEKFYPFKVYPVRSFTDSLKVILSRPGVIKLCEK